MALDLKGQAAALVEIFKDISGAYEHIRKFTAWKHVPDDELRAIVTTEFETFRAAQAKAKPAPAAPSPARVEDKPRAKAKSKYNRAKSAPRSKEIWRFIDAFPDYEISNCGRVRSSKRVSAGDALKPEFSWHRGKLVACYALYLDGQKFKRFLGPLMVQAGFTDKPSWWK